MVRAAMATTDLSHNSDQPVPRRQRAFELAADFRDVDFDFALEHARFGDLDRAIVAAVDINTRATVVADKNGQAALRNPGAHTG